MRRLFVSSLIATILAIVSSTANAQVPLDTSFKFQGELRLSNVVVDQISDFRFAVFGNAVGGAPLGNNPINNVPVSRGVFTVTLDFGAGIFTGDKRWLEIQVRSPAGAGVFTTLAPRVELTATPNALFALDIANGSVSTAKIINGAVTLAKLAPNSVNSARISDGSVSNADLGPNSVNSSKINDGSVTNADLAANSVTTDKIQPNVLSSVDGVINDGGNINLIAGPNMTIVPSDAANTITFSASSDAGTLDGLDSGQFLRADASDIIIGDTVYTISGGSNTLTFGGANITLNLGDTSADVTNASGSLNVGTTLVVDGNSTLGNTVSDATTVNGELTVSDNIVTGTAGTSANFNQLGSGTPASGLIGNNGDLFVRFDGEFGADLSVRGGDIFLGASESDQEIFFFNSGSSSGEELEWDDSTDRLEWSDDMQVVGDIFVGGASSTSTCVFFNDPGNSPGLPENGVFICWDEITSTTLSGCTSLPMSSAHVFHIDDNSSSGWAFENNSDAEFVISSGGSAGADGSITAFGGCDLAELFFGPESLQPGTLVRADSSASESVEMTQTPYDSAVVGVVSTRPGFVMSGPAADAYPLMREYAELEKLALLSPDDAALNSRMSILEAAIDSAPRGSVAVALAGRVPVKVTGNVQVGDALTSSDVAGHAMAMDRPGPSIGIALENSSGRDTVVMLVQPGWRNPQGVADDTARRVDITGAGDQRSNSMAQFEDRLAQLESVVRTRSVERVSGESITTRDGSTSRDGVDGRDGNSGSSGETLPVVRLQKESWGDFDADGLDDVVVLNPGTAARLFRNLGDGRFQDVTETAGLGDTRGLRIALWEDYDSNQDLDLLLVDAKGVAALFQGSGSGRFNDMTEALRLDFGQPIVEAEWLDYDRDGLPDLRVEIADGTLILHHNVGRGQFEQVELRAALTDDTSGSSARRIADLESENAGMKARLQALEQLVQSMGEAK